MTDRRNPPSAAMRCGWCRDPLIAEDIARFFVAHADPAYISHSELQGGRALAPGRWADDLAATIEGEAHRAIQRARDDDGLSGTRLAVLSEGEALRAMAFVTFAATARRPFATLEDLLVAATGRGAGLGQMLLDWIGGECRAGGFDRLFLESGIDNGRAHHFFERNGFAPTSIVMMRAL